MSRSRYFNLPIDIFDTIELLDLCSKYYQGVGNNLIFFINAHCFNLAQHSADYRNALETADLVLNDGIGIRLGSLLAGIRVKENMNGTDLIPKIIEHGASSGMKVYLLGGEKNIAAIAKENLLNRIPGLLLVGERSGYFDFDDDQEIIDEIISLDTDILIVGMGVPRQELWLAKNKERLSGVKLSIAGGAIIDFLAHKVKRAPKWMQKSGLEWLFRLIQEPVRLFRRYFLGIPIFIFNILMLKFSIRFKRGF